MKRIATKTEMINEILRLRNTEDDIKLFKILYSFTHSEIEEKLMYEINKRSKL